MLIWLDILTPKQVHFLGELGQRLEERGHSVFRTIRDYKEVNELVRLKNMTTLSVGKHGGASLDGKLVASANRIQRLAKIIGRLKPDLSIAFASPEAARTAFGLGIPHYTVNDSPHSTSVARLTVPLSTKLFSPSIISKETWKNLGAELDSIIQYDALDPVAWLKTFIPNSSVLGELSLETAQPIVVVRVEEAFASYLLGHVSERESITIPIIREIREYDPAIQIVVLPRYREQIQTLKAVFQDQVRIPQQIIDGPNLLFFASVFIGAGGTMTAEAALLGTPTISCFPRDPTMVDDYLIKKKLINRLKSPKDVFRKVTQILDDSDEIRRKQRELARKLLSQMEDPIDVIITEVERGH
jgi:predicted glycosyltransferase